MSDFFGKLMTRIVALAGFPLIVYESETKRMFRFNANGVENIPVPPVIASDIENEDTCFANKTSGNQNIVIYFFRWVFGGKKYVIVINDVSNRAKLSRFVNILATVLKEMQANRDALLERIKILKNSLDNSIQDREKAVLELQACQSRLDRAIIVRNDAVDRLNSIMVENNSLQNSVSASENKAQKLEIALAQNNRLLEQVRIESEEKDFAVRNLEKSVDEAKKTTAAEYDSKMAQLVKVRNEAVIRLKAQIEVNSTLKTSVATVQDAVRRLELSVKEKEERIALMRAEFDNQPQSPQHIKEYEAKLAKVIEVRNEAINRLKALTAENERLKSAVIQPSGEPENSSSMANESVRRLELSVKEKEGQIASMRAELDRQLQNQQNLKESEEKLKKVIEVRNEAINRLKALTAENERLKSAVIQPSGEPENSSSMANESVRRLELSVKEKEGQIASMRAELDRQLQNQQNLKESEEKLKKVIEVRNEAINRLKALTAENERLKSASAGSSAAEFQKTVKEKDDEIQLLNKTINEKNEIVKEKDAKIAKTRFYLEEMTELVKVVKRSRDKIMTLTDFITVPMYSVSGERLLVHANNALATYVKASSVTKIVGKSCHKLIFNLDKPCPWCQLEKVQKSGASTTVGVIVNDAGKRRNIELTIFPILDSTGTLIDCGEFIVDKTDTFELAQSLQKFKEQVMNFKRAKISGMNEIQDVKNAYDELSNNYDLVVARNNKLSQALESLLVQDNNKEVISAKNEASEYKATAHRYSGMITNYKKNLEELQAKYATLNRQTFAQLERLINVVKAKPSTDLKEIGDMLSSIGINFNDVSKLINRN